MTDGHSRGQAERYTVRHHTRGGNTMTRFTRLIHTAIKPVRAGVRRDHPVGHIIAARPPPTASKLIEASYSRR